MWRASGTVTAANRVIYYSSKYHLSFGIYLSKIQGTLDPSRICFDEAS